MNEDLLITLLKEANEEGFRMLMQLYGDRIYNTALGILQQVEDAEDITQEVFAEIFQSVNQFKGDSKLFTWIYRITVTKCLEHIRKKNRKKNSVDIQSLFGQDGLEPITDAPHFHHPGVELENKERAALLFKAIYQLPENQKTAFILNKVEGLSYAEICEIMELSLSSIESLLFRAKQNLKMLLNDYYEKNK